jgi:CRP/FNR family transcriptional regulator
MADVQFKMEHFSLNTFIMVEGKTQAHNFYIIRAGKVKITKDSPVVGEEPATIFGPGDFFGVISCMSGHARIDSAIALGDVSVISVNKDQFGTLIQKNPIIAMKIIRFFSKKLRSFDQTITRISFKGHTEDENLSHLFNIGEYYFQHQNFYHAAFAYNKFVKSCPNDARVSQAKVRLTAMNINLGSLGYIKSEGLNRSYKDDSMIFCENEPGNELYIIQQGKVKITKIMNNNEVLLAVLNAGDIFGEMALLENKPRSASAITFGDVQLLAINKANFETMVQAQPQLATKLIVLLSERVWVAYKQLANLSISDPLGRMYDTLLTLVEKNKIRIESGKEHNFEMSAKDLIKMVGLPPEKGDQLIMKLMEDRDMKLVGGKLVCMNLQNLEKQVQFYRKKSAMERKRELASQNR